MLNLLPPPNFQGFDSSGKVRIYTRHLPHWRQEGATYFVTFRLADSLPAGRIRELAYLREQWEQRNPPPRNEAAWEALTRTTMERVERWLDAGSGSCQLRRSEAAALVEQSLRHYDGQQYDLNAFVIMPNHVHLLVRPYSDCDHPLERIEQAWKSHSSRNINELFGASGALWQTESFDRIVRDDEHLLKCIHYIGSNPRRAGLNVCECPRWIREDWRRLGWQFDDS